MQEFFVLLVGSGQASPKKRREFSGEGCRGERETCEQRTAVLLAATSLQTPFVGGKSQGG